MTEVTLNRTGKRPVVFTGREVASANSRWSNSTEWVKSQVFFTDKGKYVAGVIRQSTNHRDDHYDVREFDTTEILVAFLEQAAPEVAGVIARRLGVAEVL